VQRLRLENLRRRSVDDPTAEDEVPVAKETLAELEDRLRLRRLDQERLRLTAPRAGIVLPPPGDEPPELDDTLPRRKGTPLEERNLGSTLAAGELFCLVGDPRLVEAVLAVAQDDVEFVRAGQRVWLRLAELPGETVGGRLVEVAERELASVSRELAAQGDMATQLGPDGVRRPLATVYQVRVALDEPSPRVLIGAAGRARIEADSLSLARRLARFLSGTFRLAK
jgi:putative peptide zinc metalloprotease protein